MAVLRVREATRRRALAAMAEAVAERGYADTTVRDVLERARMSRRTFYELFANREACFLAAYDLASHAAMQRLECPPERDGTAWEELVSAALDGLLRHLASSPELAWVLVVEPVSVGRQGLERHQRTMREITERLVRCHPQGHSGAPSVELRLRCEAGVGAVQSVVHERLVEGRARELPRLAPDLASLLSAIAPAE